MNHKIIRIARLGQIINGLILISLVAVNSSFWILNAAWILLFEFLIKWAKKRETN